MSANLTSGPGPSALRGLGRLGGVIAWTFAAVTGAVLALIFAGAVVVASLMGVVLLTLAATFARGRRTVRQPADPDVIEARNIGGHSWVAYGWDGRR